MKHCILSLATLALFSMPFSAQAGGDGSGGFARGGAACTNWDLVNHFMTSYLTGKRVDPYWNYDEANVYALDDRIYQLEALLGYTGIPLAALREELDLGMTRYEYEMSAAFAIRAISEALEGRSDGPMAYRGYIARAEVTTLLVWHADGSVSGLYHHAPARGDIRPRVLRGHNQIDGKLFLLEATGSTQSARLYFEKEVVGNEIVWNGFSKASSGRRDPAVLARCW